MVEILIAVAIIVVALLMLFSMATVIIKEHGGANKTSQAVGLAQEALEATRSFRNGTSWPTNGLGTLTIGAPYHPQLTGVPPQWELAEGEETVGIFKRKIIFSNARRDAGGNIIDSGGVEDANTKKVEAVISWEGKSINIVAYLTNWK